MKSIWNKPPIKDIEDISIPIQEDMDKIQLKEILERVINKKAEFNALNKTLRMYFEPEFRKKQRKNR